MKNAAAPISGLLRPADILAGIGAADRAFLATCLALFDDSKLMRRIVKWVGKGQEGAPSVGDDELYEAHDDVRSRRTAWESLHYTDDQLRLVLYIRLREALGIPARISVTLRGCDHLADDLAAHLIHFVDPPGLARSSKRWLRQKGWLKSGEQAVGLAEILLPVLDEMIADSLVEEDGAFDQDTRRQKLIAAVSTLATRTEREQQELVRNIGANDLNDAVLRNTLIIGGSLSAFGTSVGAAGFSAYIAAAKASAFIPFVTGPGLVSFVAVVANPVTIVFATGGAWWWYRRSARQRVNAAVATRVAAMLVVQGLQAGRASIEKLRQSFAYIPVLDQDSGLRKSTRLAYNDEWAVLEPFWRDHGDQPSNRILDLMGNPVTWPETNRKTKSGLYGRAGEETENAAAMGTMTLGDMVYSFAAVHPAVIQAADFSRLSDVDGRFAFADVARDILAGSTAAVRGGISQLKGYVAERFVAAELTAAGHIVSFPESASEPGWDLLVDGQPIQVKFQATIEGLREHFERYDYPVIANEEMAGEIPDEWRDKVFFVNGLGNELVEDVTRESVEAGADMMTPSVVHMAGTLSVVRAFVAYRRGLLSGLQGVEQILVDGSVRMGLAGTGAIMGAGFGMLVFGPAGAWVFGAATPMLAQMQTSRVVNLVQTRLRGHEHEAWESQAHDSLDKLQRTVIGALGRKRRLIARKRESAPANEAGVYLRWRLSDEGRFTRECERRLLPIDRANWMIPHQRAGELLRQLAFTGIHPATYQSEMRGLQCAFEQSRPGLFSLLDVQGATKWAGGKYEWAQKVAERANVTDNLKHGWNRLSQWKRRR